VRATAPRRNAAPGIDRSPCRRGFHEALESLAQVDARLAQVVQMRYFGGYSEQEIAETLEVTERTVQRLWLKARMMLLASMQG
jgi:RNA polymerase sigma factor (sigma-70 family)